MVRLSKYASPFETNALLCSLLSTFPEEALITLTSSSLPCWLNASWWANYKMAVYVLSLAWNFCLPQSILFCLWEWISCPCSENTNILHKSRGQHLSWNTTSSCNICNHADFPLTTQTWSWGVSGPCRWSVPCMGNPAFLLLSCFTQVCPLLALVDILIFMFLLLNVYSFTWLCQVLTVAHESLVLNTGSSSNCCALPWLLHGMWDLSSLARDWTHISCIGTQILNHWTTREVPGHLFWFLYFMTILPSMEFPGDAVVENPLAKAGYTGSVSGLGKNPWSRKWQSISVFLPGNAMDRRAWPSTVYGVTKNWTWLSTHSRVPILNSTECFTNLSFIPKHSNYEGEYLVSS